jgi:hypothetical protein
MMFPQGYATEGKDKQVGEEMTLAQTRHGYGNVGVPV